jgi:hypothetical protein
MIHVEAITVCVGYDDFLAETARYNLPLFDRWIIVTTPDDHATRELCRRRNLHCLLSEDAQKGDFAKGRLIERGLHLLSAEGWRLHLDADIVLPPRFRHLTEAADLQKDTIYGVDRLMVRSWDEWQQVQRSRYLHDQYSYHSQVKFPAHLPLGSRWVSPQLGYCPIGYFQLWHSSADLYKGIRSKPYPVKHNDACRTDVQHALQWDRSRRALLPEIVAIHLESQLAPLGANWKGRTTRTFGPSSREHCQEPSY